MKAIKFKIVSRKEYKNRTSDGGIRLVADIYYILNNKGQIVRKIPQIIKSEYRRTDINMVCDPKKNFKPTDYYSKKHIKEFRDKFLNESQEDIKNLSDKSPRKSLNKEQIIEINNYFLNDNYSCLTQLSYLAGSNVSGCESNKLNQPYFIIDDYSDEKAMESDQWESYIGFNPFNPFKDKSLFKPDKNLKINSIEEITEIITFQQYFQQYPKVEGVETYKKFLEANKLRKTTLNSTFNIQAGLKLGTESKKRIRKSKSIPLLDLEALKKETEEFVHYKIQNEEWKDISKWARQRFGTEINWALHNDKMSQPSILKDEKASDYEKAHIIGLNYLKNDLFKNKTISLEEKIEIIIQACSFENALFLSPNAHVAFDNNQITFNEEGYLIQKNGANRFEKDSSAKIKDIDEFELRKHIIKKNFDHFLKTGKNLSSKY